MGGGINILLLALAALASRLGTSRAYGTAYDLRHRDDCRNVCGDDTFTMCEELEDDALMELVAAAGVLPHPDPIIAAVPADGAELDAAAVLTAPPDGEDVVAVPLPLDAVQPDYAVHPDVISTVPPDGGIFGTYGGADDEALVIGEPTFRACINRDYVSFAPDDDDFEMQGCFMGSHGADAYRKFLADAEGDVPACCYEDCDGYAIGYGDNART